MTLDTCARRAAALLVLAGCLPRQPHPQLAAQVAFRVVAPPAELDPHGVRVSCEMQLTPWPSLEAVMRVENMGVHSVSVLVDALAPAEITPGGTSWRVLRGVGPHGSEYSEGDLLGDGLVVVAPGTSTTLRALAPLRPGDDGVVTMHTGRKVPTTPIALLCATQYWPSPENETQSEPIWVESVAVVIRLSVDSAATRPPQRR